MGQIAAPVHLVQTEEEVDELDLPARHAGRLCDADDASASTTPSGIIAALQRRFTDIVGPETRDICYATQNRQTAVRELSKLVDVILVVGAQEQLQFQPAARDRRGGWHAELSDRRRQRARAANGSTAPRWSASPPALRRRRCWSRT